MRTPEDVGMRVNAGSRIVLNIHYHPTGLSPEVDGETRVELDWMDDQPTRCVSACSALPFRPCSSRAALPHRRSAPLSTFLGPSADAAARGATSPPMRSALLLITSLSACYAGSELGPVQEADSVPSDVGSSTSGVGEPEPEGPAGSSSSTGVASSDETGLGPQTGSATGSAGETSTGEPETGSSSGDPPLLGCDALPDALLCEDFDGELDPSIWQTVNAPGAEAVLVDGQLQIQLTSLDNAQAFIRTESIFPVADNRFFGRVMLQITPYSPTGHDYLMSAEGPLNGSTARYRLDSNNSGRLNSRYTHASVPEHGGWRKLGYQTEGKAWTCLEWEFDGATNSMRFWFDGELDEDMLVDGAVEDPSWEAPAFERFELGYRTYQAALNGDDFTISYDDLALDVSRIGCPDQRSSG